MQPSDEFFAGSTYAVFGARAPGRMQGPVLIAALNKAGKRAVAVEPDGAAVKGASSAPTLAQAGPVDGCVLLPPSPWNASAASFAADAARQCAAVGVSRLWIYTDGNPAAALTIAREQGLDPVAGRCPCLHIVGAGFPHGLHRWMLQIAKQL